MYVCMCSSISQNAEALIPTQVSIHLLVSPPAADVRLRHEWIRGQNAVNRRDALIFFLLFSPTPLAPTTSSVIIPSSQARRGVVVASAAATAQQCCESLAAAKSNLWLISEPGTENISPEGTAAVWVCGVSIQEA